MVDTTCCSPVDSLVSGIRDSKSSTSRRRRGVNSMNTYWITFYGFLIFSTNAVLASWGQSDFEVRLVAKKYVEKGSNLLLRCDNNVQREILYKVRWLKNGNKIFEYINGRNPPYRNFSTPGAVIDWKYSNDHQVMLRSVDFDAAGDYSCEVSTDTPIYTKESNVDYIHVIQPQTGPPKIAFSKRQFYIGENLEANCTTSRARPQPHITWLINGKKVDDKHIRMLAGGGGGGGSGGSKSNHRPKTQPHSGNNPQSVDKSSDVDIVDAQFPRMPDISKGGDDNELQQRLNSRMEKIENYPHYRFAEQQQHQHEGEYQRVVFDEDGYVHSKHIKRPRNGNSNKNRRHVSEGVKNMHRPYMAASMLVMEVSELHADMNGRLEITCLATIPAHVGPGEQFADYKTYSVKIDVEQNEVTTAVPQPAKLGNNISGNGGSSSASTSRAWSSWTWWQRQHLIQVGLSVFLIVFQCH